MPKFNADSNLCHRSQRVKLILKVVATCSFIRSTADAWLIAAGSTVVGGVGGRCDLTPTLQSENCENAYGPFVVIMS
jgi:hypothetical protein